MTTTWFRQTVWRMKGNREYLRQGFEAATARFHPSDLDVDCTGRHCMITGANRGIGFSAAFELAKRGAVLHLVCRDLSAAKDARATIVSETGNDKIHLYELDLSEPREVAKFCDNFLVSHDQLHILINNAGVMLPERILDADGIEHNFAVNTLAVHIMVTSFVPLLQRCEDSRVITVSSAGMLLVKLDPVDLMHGATEPFDGRSAFSQNKRQQMTLTFSYAQNFDKIHFSCMHPGQVDTKMMRISSPEFYELNKDRLRTPQQGADTIVWLALSARATTYSSGLFFQDREAVSPHLPLAWTRSTMTEEKMFLERLHEITSRIRSVPQPSVTESPQFVESTNSHPNGLEYDTTNMQPNVSANIQDVPNPAPAFLNEVPQPEPSNTHDVPEPERTSIQEGSQLESSSTFSTPQLESTNLPAPEQDILYASSDVPSTVKGNEAGTSEGQSNHQQTEIQVSQEKSGESIGTMGSKSFQAPEPQTNGYTTDFNEPSTRVPENIDSNIKNLNLDQKVDSEAKTEDSSISETDLEINAKAIKENETNVVDLVESNNYSDNISK